jgi:hypothetical protein
MGLAGKGSRHRTRGSILWARDSGHGTGARDLDSGFGAAESGHRTLTWDTSMGT